MGARLDEILSRRASPVVYYYQDIQGSIRGLTDSSSKPIQAYEYTAFGDRQVSSRSKQFLLLDKLIDQPYGFTGRPMEELTGLYYYRYRDYNPGTGRFLQPDPLGQLPGPNIYSYCQNNPVNWVDPWGMDKDYSEEETRNIITRAVSNLIDDNPIVDLADAMSQHGGSGEFDYRVNEPTSTFIVNGETIEASQFGNYLAGYATTVAFGYFGSIATFDAGVVFGWGDGLWLDDPESQWWIFQGVSDAESYNNQPEESEADNSKKQ